MYPFVKVVSKMTTSLHFYFLLVTIGFNLATASPLPQPQLDPRSSTSTTTSYTNGSTANDVVNGVCAPLTVLFARGTGEIGNLGTVVGPSLFQSLASQFSGNVALQGVDYAADVTGVVDLGAGGGAKMAALAKQALTQCPQTKLALTGYSQGAMVVHSALDTQGGTDTLSLVAMMTMNSVSTTKVGVDAKNVVAVVYFGDPLDGLQGSGAVPATLVQDNCAIGDDVCEGHSPLFTAAHLLYAPFADEAAKFIAGKLGT